MEVKQAITAVVVGVCSLAAVSPANAATWDIDGKHSSANFKVQHMMISGVRGQMGGISGSVDYDGKNIDDIKVKAQLDPATINTGDSGRDTHLKNADFFDVTKYPSITFESTGTIPILGGGFKLGGNLTMHGVTKKVELSVDGPTEPIKDAKGKTRIGAAATTTVRRKDFGIVYNSVLETGGVAIGEDVQITIELELVKRDDKAAETSSTSSTQTPSTKESKGSDDSGNDDKKSKKEKKEKVKKEKKPKEPKEPKQKKEKKTKDNNAG